MLLVSEPGFKASQAGTHFECATASWFLAAGFSSISAMENHRTLTHFECAMASRFLVAGFSSISAMEKAAAMATKVTRASTATATWMRYGMLQQSVKRGSRPGFRDRWFRV